MIDAPEQTDAAALSPTRQWIALAALTLPVLLISMDGTILGFAVPRLSESLRPTSSQLLWIIDVYSFVLAGLLVTMGNLGDRIGRRRLLVWGAGAFGVASALAAVSTSSAMLIGSRAALGIAGATLLPSTLSLIRNVFPDHRKRQTAIAVWAAMFSVGSAVGPLLGGVLLERFWWGSVFLVGVPVALVLVVMAPRVVPESKDPDPGPFDLGSAALSIATMLPAVYGIKKLAEHGVAADAFVALAFGIVAGIAFVRRQQRSESPMIDVTLFRLPRFRTAISGNLIACFGFAGSLFFITQYLQLVVGLSPVRAGLQLLPAIVVSITSSLRSPWLARRFGAFAVIATGLTIGGCGFVALSQLRVDSSLVLVTVAVMLINAGFSMAMTVAVDGIIASVPAAKAGAGASVSETANELGFALGTALLGSIMTVVYRYEFTDLIGVDAATIREARETLGAAERAAERIGGSGGAALRALAHESFMDGITIASAVAAVLVFIAASRAAVTARADLRERRAAALVGGG